MKTIFLLAILTSFDSHAFTLNIEFDETVTPDLQKRILDTRQKMEELVKTDLFKNKMMSFQNYSCFNANNLPENVTNLSEAYENILQAVGEIKISIFEENSSTIGSTSGNHISLNNYFLKQEKDSALANTLLHEGLHSVGYGHCGQNNPRLHPKIIRAIPYRLGNLVESIYQD